MNNHEKRQSFSDRDVDDQQQSTDDSSSVSCGTSEGSPAAVSGGTSGRRNGNDLGLAARLTDLFVGDGDCDGDLLMQRSTQDGTVVRWLRALDMQVMGACRADERLKPLLKLNVSSVAEDRLLSHLSQHFEPSEVGLLARCLCIPLVSIRVGKINKQGTLLIPTSARGNLTLSLLPNSDMRMSFLGDDGQVERLLTLRNISDCSSIVIEGMPADNSGRSFVVRVPSSEPFYFWCSEKSRLLGNELLEKMKSLLDKKPSLTELTGISDSRLQRFVAHLRTYFVGSSSLNNNTSLSRNQASTTSAEAGQTLPLSKPSRIRSCSIQGSLSPRSSSFKEGLPRNMASFRSVVRDKLRRRGEGTVPSFIENLCVPSPTLGEASTLNHNVKVILPEVSVSSTSLSGVEPDATKKAVGIPSPSSAIAASSLFSPPYYCWCPPVASTLQYTVAPPYTSAAESFTLPPLTSLLASSAPRSSSGLITPTPILNLAETQPFLPETSVRSQPIPTFNPLMCDPIVHIPVIDICSSGQAFLVSAGPASIPPLVQETDSMAEKSARNTLHLLISGSSQLPSVLANTEGNQNILYGGAMDVKNAIANSIAAMSLVSLSERSGVISSSRCIDQDDLVHLLEDPVDSGGTCSSEDGFSLSDLGDGKGRGRSV